MRSPSLRMAWYFNAVKLLFSIAKLDCSLGPLFEGAVTEGDWGSVVMTIGHSLSQPFRAATSLREGGKAAALL